jgi:hypothetical protein
MQFYSDKAYLKYNMFNNHFFHGNKTYLNFIKSSNKTLILIDPPYGGLVKLIANTVKNLTQDCLNNGKQASIILVYPYFMENWIQKWSPDLKMTDFKVYFLFSFLLFCHSFIHSFKVTYCNQRNFSDKTSNKGSSARLFTNIKEINQVEIPRMDELKDYYYCELCEKYTFLQNKHCFKCSKCTSRDGGLYKHCEICKKCVKNSYLHCKSCNVCHLKDNCWKKDELKCFKCQSLEHKSKDCDFKEQ